MARDHIPIKRERVEFLLGFSHKALALPRKVLKHPDTPLYRLAAVQMPIGWTIVPGLISQKPEEVKTCGVRAIACAEDEGDMLTERFQHWLSSEVMGIVPSQTCNCPPNVIEEANFLMHIRNGVRRTPDGRLEVKMPWKPGYPECLKNNRRAALGALVNLEKTLEKKGLSQAYAEEMQRTIEEYAEPVPEDKIHAENAWYLQHFLVEHQSKLRIVWNSAAKYQGKSLNDGLEKGPNLLNELLVVLINFRNGAVAYQGDVAKMFNQVKLFYRDRNFHRFVWKNRDYRWCRMLFGDRPAPDISQYCLRYLANEFQADMPDGARVIKDHSYMDDIVKGADTEEQAKKEMEQAEEILGQGSFTIKDWHSNVRALETFDEEQETTVLGIPSDKQGDCLCIQDPEWKTILPTRRSILSAVSKIWDPLGVLAPVLVETKLAMQSLARQHKEWDEVISEEEVTAWRNRFQDLEEAIEGVKLSRNIRTYPGDTGVLHGFCDAGQKAYGAVFWLAQQDRLTFITAKSLGAPADVRTIPRLELMAAQLASRLLVTIRKALGDLETVIWTDSECVLKWIQRSGKQYKAFTAARLQEINENVPGAAGVFRYVPGEINPAESLTKPIIDAKMLKEWLEGPNFVLNREQWPKQPGSISEESMRKVEEEEKSEKQKRKKSAKPKVGQTLINIRRLAAKNWNEDDYGSWEELVDGVAKRTGKSPEEAVDEAFRTAQIDLKKDGLEQDGRGIWRKKGRLEESRLPEHMKRPMLLDGTSRISKLYLRHLHEDTMHKGNEYLVNHAFADRGVIVTGGRKLASEIVKACGVFREQREKPETPQMGQLPKQRTLYKQAPLSAVGVDFVGSIKIEEGGKEIVGNILLITCLTTRACHLEVTRGATADDFMNAWRRFVLRNGIHPMFIFSDSAQAFKSAKPKVGKLSVRFNHQHPEEEHFQWEFALPNTPHRRGVIECFVKTVKNAMRAANKNKQSMEEWELSCCKIMSLLNSRFLVNPTKENKELPISANWVLHPYKEFSTSVGVMEIIADARKTTEEFWIKWKRSVPRELFEYPKWEKSVPAVKVGDKVLVIKGGFGNQKTDRRYWTKGEVKRCIESKDKIVRKVITENEEGKKRRVAVQNLVIITPESKLF